MVKVKNNGKLEWCLEKYAAGKITVKWAVNHLKITLEDSNNSTPNTKPTTITPP
jgi:hypothetical protein